MSRSAKRPKAGRKKHSALQAGAAAIGGLIADNPVLVGSSTAFLVTLFYVSANALWYQPFPHKGPFFATRSVEHVASAPADEAETTIVIERPAAQDMPEVASVPATLPVPSMRDSSIQQVQEILKDLGFYADAVDGLDGPNTQKAVMAYQNKVGLTASGRIDDALLEQLGVAPATASVVPRPAPRTDASVGRAQDSEARIVKIQAGLKAFGNDDIKLDGVMGARTRAAIREFQSLFGLPQTGEPDQVVYDKMRDIGLTN